MGLVAFVFGPKLLYSDLADGSKIGVGSVPAAKRYPLRGLTAKEGF